MHSRPTDKLMELYRRIVGWLSSHEREAVSWYVCVAVSLLAALSIHYIIKANTLL